ncbi:MAG: hypothetical protein ACREDZ_01540 [Kiloniellales bacterium]
MKTRSAGQVASMRARPRQFRWLLPILFLIAMSFLSVSAGADDTLILTNDMKNGTLEGCSGGACTFEGAAIPRASIYYIGLDAELPPPAPQDGTRDEVHLRDGSVHPGPLMSIDATNVVTASAVHPRKLVTWIWLTPLTSGEGQGQAAPPTGSDAAGDAAEARPIYAWDGTIRVENEYNGNLGNSGSGHHRWRAEYRVKLFEVMHGTSPFKKLEPQQLDYEIHADQAYEIEWDADDYRSLTMLGVARGRLTGEDFAGNRYLTGNIVSLDAPLIASHQPPHSFATYFDGFLPYYQDVLTRMHSGSGPGWYFLDLGFSQDTYARARALYDGIRRGGTLPPVVSDPDHEFLEHVPPWMLHFTYLVGRLDHPEQSEVHGGFTLSYDGHWPDAPDQITVEWSFARTRVSDQP